MGLSDEAKKARNEYLREWRRNNPERVKKHQKDYWERMAREQEQEQKQA